MLAEMRGTRGFVFAFFAACAAGCSDPATPPPGCVPPPAPSCPDPAPSYAADVAPIFQTYCVRCHGPGGVEFNKPLDSWAQVNSRYGSVLQQVFYFCAMPPATEPQLTDPAARTALLGWLACMAPNN
jgi:mono/diheme cytochrome c family protein